MFDDLGFGMLMMGDEDETPVNSSNALIHDSASDRRILIGTEDNAIDIDSDKLD